MQEDERQAVRQSISENASFGSPFLTMNALATVVASYGLLEDSAAVVIGAMVIATLLGPISGIALALVDGDGRLLRRSLATEASGVLLVLLVSLVIGWIHRDLPLTREILSRTDPNILDLMIALGGGAAGAYATVSKRLSVGLVGVAIATALVPPLSVCGLCLARADFRLAFGAFLLFLTNLVAIQVASSVVMWLHGFRKIISRSAHWRTIVVEGVPNFTLFFGLTVFLGLHFHQSLAKHLWEAEVRARLAREFQTHIGVHLAEVRFARDDDNVIVTAVVRTPFFFTPAQIAAIESKLPSPGAAPVRLHVRSVLTKEATGKGIIREVQDPLGPAP